MDKETQRAWLDALKAEEFSVLAMRISLISHLTGIAMAVGMGRGELSDTLTAYYLTEPREMLDLFSLDALRVLRNLRGIPLPFPHRSLDGPARALMETLRQLALAHRGRSGWLVSDFAFSLCDLSPEEEHGIREDDLLLARVRGTLLLTGMLPIETLRRYVGLPDTERASERMMNTVARRTGRSRFAETPRGVWALSDYLVDPVRLYRRVTRAELAETPRALLTERHALEAHRFTLPVLMADAMPVLNCVAESGGDGATAGRELLFLAENYPLREAREIFLTQHPELAESRLARTLPELLEPLPLWANLGHTEGEVAGLSVPGSRPS